MHERQLQHRSGARPHGTAPRVTHRRIEDCVNAETRRTFTVSPLGACRNAVVGPVSRTTKTYERQKAESLTPYGTATPIGTPTFVAIFFFN